MINISNKLEKKYNNGARIVLIISLLTIPLQLITSAIISRVSAEASGILGIIELFYNVIITFFLFGGETAVVKLLSDIEKPIDKKSFLLYYTGFSLLYFTIFTVGLRIFKVDIIKIILGVESETTLGMYIVAIVIIINSILLSYIKEREEFLLYSIGIKIFNLAIFLATIYIAMFGTNDFEVVYYEFIFWLNIIFEIFVIFKCILGDKRELFKIKCKKSNFFKYALFLHLSTIVVFLYDKTDQIIIVNKFGISTLGGYYLIVKLVNMIKLIPNIYNSTFYPYICKVLNKDSSQNIFNNILHRNLLIIFPLSIIVVLNSELIIKILFGVEYLKYNFVLQVYILIVIMSAPAIILNNYLFALGKSKQYFFISFLSVIIQLIFMYLLINYLGVEGLAISKVIAAILTIILCRYYLIKLGFKTKFIKQYYVYCLLIGIIIYLANKVNIGNLTNIILSLIILGIFAFVNLDKIKTIIIVKSFN